MFPLVSWSDDAPSYPSPAGTWPFHFSKIRSAKRALFTDVIVVLVLVGVCVFSHYTSVINYNVDAAAVCVLFVFPLIQKFVFCPMVAICSTNSKRCKASAKSAVCAGTMHWKTVHARQPLLERHFTANGPAGTPPPSLSVHLQSRGDDDVYFIFYFIAVRAPAQGTVAFTKTGRQKEHIRELKKNMVHIAHVNQRCGWLLIEKNSFADFHPIKDNRYIPGYRSFDSFLPNIRVLFLLPFFDLK